MGVSGLEHFDRIEAKLGGLLEGMAPDLHEIGQTVAEGVVQSTLAGIGDGDQPFAPYSPPYQQAIDAVGGKPQQTVNLRGLFYHEGQAPAKFKSEARRQQFREGRQGVTGVAFTTAGGKTIQFAARTGVTRPSLGLTDSRSEMSLDRLSVLSTDNSVTILYTPRDNAYMIDHNNGTGTAPERKWFTLNKTAIKSRILAMTHILLQSRITWWNTQR